MTIRRTSLCLSMLLLLVLCFALLPAQALAAGDFDTPRELEVLSMSSAPVFRSGGESQTEAYYLVGTMNEWQLDNAYRLSYRTDG